MKLCTTFGFELTFVSNRNKEMSNEYDYIEKLVEIMQIELKEHGCKFFKITNDCQALEISTIPFNNIKSIKIYCDKIFEIIKKYPLTAKSNYFYGGGGHIHVGLNKLLKNMDKKYKFIFLLNLFKDMQNRPYLNWIFNEYCDNQSAEPFYSSSHHLESYNAFANIFDLITQRWILNNIDDIYSCFKCDKKHFLRVDFNKIHNTHTHKLNHLYSEPTVEFRIFDAQSSFNELFDHILFVNAYLMYIKKITNSRKIIECKVFSKKDTMKFFDNPSTIKEFNKLLKQLGLTHQKYRK